MLCLAEIDAGAERARQELLFLSKLMNLVELVGGIESQPNVSGALGFADVYRCPTCRTGDYIRVSKDSESLVEQLSALRVHALERVGRVVVMAQHASSLPHPNAPDLALGRLPVLLGPP